MQVGWTVTVPGAVWGEHAADDKTRKWAERNHDKLFEVIIEGLEGSNSFVIRHQQEEAFPIPETEMANYLTESQKKEIRDMGGPDLAGPFKAGRKMSPTLLAAKTQMAATEARFRPRSVSTGSR